MQATITKTLSPAQHAHAICFAVDENFFPYAYFVAKKILSLHPQKQFDVCICVPDISLVTDQLDDPNIRFCEINIQGISHLPIDHLSIAAYYRFFLPQLFKAEYTHILYLDADTYVTRAFANEFFDNIQTKSFVLAAAPDVSVISLKCDSSLKEKAKKDLEAPFELCDQAHIYRNSGVLAFNVAAYVSNNYLDRIFTFALNNPSKLIQHDQSAMNIALGKDISILSFNYNWQSNRVINHAMPEFNPAIIHFIRDQKPWLGNTHRMSQKYYQEYADFFSVYFPALQINSPDHTYQLRKENPKYTNRAKELFSLLGLKLKKRLNTINMRWLSYLKSKKTIQFIQKLNGESVIR